MATVKRRERPEPPAKPASEPLVAWDVDEPRFIVVGRDAKGQPIYAAVSNPDARDLR